MAHRTDTQSTPARSVARSVALPVEHGGWAFLLQPIALGLLVSPSPAGVCLGLAALFAFLAHHPLKLAIGDWRRGKRYPRTGLAERFFLAYGAAAAVALAGAVALAAGAPPRAGDFWIPLAIGALFAGVQLIYDARKRSREALAELSGALALGSLAPAIAVLGGWDLREAWVVWPLLAAQAMPAILYARARLRLERGQAISAWPVWAAHAAGLGVAIALAGLQLGPWLAAAAMLVMLARALHGLSRFRRPATARQVGFQEVAMSALTVALIAIGSSEV
jgi:hypothetical protein